jgi:hypothetical protein
MIYEREIYSTLYRYDGDTGRIWRLYSGSLGTSPARWVETAIGRNALGYRYVYCTVQKGKYVQLLAHRMALFIVHGEWPSEHVDHINHDPSDNRLVNLRSVSCAENMRNQRRLKSGVAGYLGVRPCRKKWQARVQIDNREMSLGVFATKEEAAKVAAAARKEMGFHENHGLVQS